MNVQILDCTLRDGGYNNEWDFGEENIKTIIQNLTDSKIDIVECGFLSKTTTTNKSKTIFSDFFKLKEYLPPQKDTRYVCMINYGEFPIEEVPKYDDQMKMGGIRVAFHKKDLSGALEYSEDLVRKGYRVYLQPMVTQNYSDEEVLNLVKKANELKVVALYIVDSFGIMKKNDILRFLYMIDNGLDQEISLGFHSHNNLQLSFSNAQEFIEYRTKRNILIDSSVMGMGRGAGNLCTELLSQYLNETKGTNYDLLPILRTIDEYINPIFIKSPWGYSIPYYIAAINACHPNYATYLSGKQTLSVEDLSSIINSIETKRRTQFDKEYIEKLYLNFQNKMVDDERGIEEISAIFKNRKVLVLAPGPSISKDEKKIRKHIEKNNPLTVSVNFYPSDLPVDVIFLSNSKRIKKINNNLKGKTVIYTSNVHLDNVENTIKINYSDYLAVNDGVIDNSGLMFMNLLDKVGVKDISLAGFDGYVPDHSMNYFTPAFMNVADVENLEKINKEFTARIQQLKKDINIEFLTKSRYDV
jgi:Isopropylmalate/homocitrate/citramalate synthases